MLANHVSLLQEIIIQFDIKLKKSLFPTRISETCVAHIFKF